MTGIDHQILFALERKKLSPWREWAEQNGLKVKLVRLVDHQKRMFKGRAYNFKLTIVGFENAINGNQLLDALNSEFTWENSYEGFVKIEPVKQQEVVHAKQKGDWSYRHNKRAKRKKAA